MAVINLGKLFCAVKTSSCVFTGLYRIRNKENFRFGIDEVALEELEKEDYYDSEIVMISRAGCPDCEKLYRELDEFIQEYPVNIKYYDCYNDRNLSPERLEKMLSRYDITQVPAVVIFDRRSYEVIPFSEDTIDTVKARVYEMARNDFYYTNFDEEGITFVDLNT